jgi:hypothetical protein
MIRRSTWVLLIIFLLALAGLLFLSRRPQGLKVIQDATPTAAPITFLDYTSEDVARLTIQPKGLPAFTLERSPQTLWQHLAVDPRPLDPAKVEELVATIPTLQAQSQLDAAPPDSATGLQSSPILITLEFKDGHKTTVRFGNLTPTSSGYYAQVDSGPVVVLNKTSFDNLSPLMALGGLVQPVPMP